MAILTSLQRAISSSSRKRRREGKVKGRGRKRASSLLAADTSTEGVFVSACDLNNSWSNSNDSHSTDSTGPSSWKSSGSKDHHKGSPLIVSSPDSERMIQDESEELGLKMARSKKLPGTWYFSSNHVMVNDERILRTVAPLVRLTELDDIARQHAEAMASKDRLFHMDPHDLQVAFSKHSRRLGENVARGRSIREIHEAMMSTRSDKNNILDRRFANMGMATARGNSGQLYLCQIFRG